MQLCHDMGHGKVEMAEVTRVEGHDVLHSSYQCMSNVYEPRYI